MNAATVLVVDDSPDDAEFYQRSLRSCDPPLKVHTAGSVAEGLARCRELRPDAVLLDYLLPDGDGLELLIALKAEVELLPALIMLTGQGDETIAVQAMKHGAMDYLVKGRLGRHELRHAVQSALHRRDLEGRVRAQQHALEQRHQELLLFTSAAAHDLRAPLRRLRMFADLLGRQGEGAPPTEQCVQAIVRAAARMEVLANDLLVFGTLEEAGEPCVEVDVRATLEVVRTDLAADLEAAKGRVRSGPLETVHGRASHMRRVLQNLIENAIKYRRAGVPPEVRVSVTHSTMEDGTPASLLEVEDNGAGFEARYAERIFQPFKRLHTESQVPGTGLGLAMCKKVAEAHGGKIAARSVPGAGSTFQLWFPRSHLEAA